MILFVGQVGSDFVDREAFQEIDYRRMYGSVAKWAAQIDRAERIPEYVAHAYRVAMSGRPGPVVLALPEDMLIDARRVRRRARVSKPSRAAPDPALVAAAARSLAQRTAAARDRRRQPLGRRGVRHAADVRRSDWRCRSPARSATRICSTTAIAHYAGDVGIGINPKLATRVREADVLLVIGERLGEMTTSGYTLLDAAGSRADADPRASRRRGARPRLSAGARDRGDARRISRRDSHRECGLRPPMARRDAEAARADYQAWHAPRPVPGALDLWQIVRWLDAASARRRDRHQRRRQLLDVAASPLSLSRLPHAARALRRLDGLRRARGVAAKAVHPDRIVVSWNGDGCFLMNGQELATAVQYGLAIVFVVVDNGMYGTIRMHQERTYPARVSGTDLINPDFAALARAYGAHGETVVAHRGVRAGVRARAGRATARRSCTSSSIRRRSR